MDRSASLMKAGVLAASNTYRDDPLSSSASVHSLKPYEYGEPQPAYTDEPPSTTAPERVPARHVLPEAAAYGIPGGRDIHCK